MSSNAEAEDQNSGCVNANTDESGSLRWFMLIIDNISLYLTCLYFFSNHFVDGGKIRQIFRQSSCRWASEDNFIFLQ